jgi:glycosyltransferase involved in cell wall biosynthesis
VRASKKAALNVHFLIAGDGAMLDHVKRVKDHLQLDNLTILGHQNREGVRRILSFSDATLVFYKPVPVLETGSPNKLFDGLAAGKIILINFKGWIKDLIERHECGVYCDPGNSLDFVEKISRLMAIPDDILQKKMRARRLAESHFSREKLSDTFVKIFNPKHF